MGIIDLLYVDEKLDSLWAQIDKKSKPKKATKFSARLGMTGPSVGIDQESGDQTISDETKYTELTSYLRRKGQLGEGRPEAWRNATDPDPRTFWLETLEVTPISFPPGSDGSPDLPAGFTLWFSPGPPESDFLGLGNDLMLMPEYWPESGGDNIKDDENRVYRFSSASVWHSSVGRVLNLRSVTDLSPKGREMDDEVIRYLIQSYEKVDMISMLKSFGCVMGAPKTVKALYRLRGTWIFPAAVSKWRNVGDENETMGSRWQPTAIGYPIVMERS